LVSVRNADAELRFGSSRAICIFSQPEVKWRTKMRFRAILTLVMLFIVTVFVACLTVAISSDALASQPHSNLFKEATERGSVSGKISSIGDASFSVDVKKSQDLVTLQFLIDDTTKVEGRLEVGSQATVDYRTDDGNNIATHVVVQAPSTPR
jgi:hypothetical protein